MCFQGCSIEPDPRVLEARMSCGLVRGHAYSVTKVIKADIETPRVKGGRTGVNVMSTSAIISSLRQKWRSS
jgi:hypothetical protein